MNEPRVTVLMPAYNAEKYIAEAIQSILDQTYSNFEFLIINDGSTDRTSTIIKGFDDPRIRLLEQSREGICNTLNRGLRKAKGFYIARFDADDISLPERLSKQVQFLDQNPDYILVGCDAEYISESGEHLFDFQCAGHTHDEIIKHIYIDCPFIHSGVMYRKQDVLDAGGYSPEAHNFEDYLLWAKMAGTGLFSNLSEQLIKVRFNPNSSTMDERWRGRRFRELKKGIIQRKQISKEEGEELLAIINRQNTQRIKEGAYYALVGKKFLLNNHQPAKARIHLAKAIHQYPFRLDNYAFYLLSYFPKPFILWLHNKK